MEAATLAPANAGVDEQTKQDAPFERFILQCDKNSLDFLGGVRLHILFLELTLAWPGPLYLVHGISSDNIAHIGHLEQAVQDSVYFDTGSMSFALGLHGQEQGRNVSWGNIGHFQITQGRIDPMVETALVGAPTVLAHCHGFGGHEHLLAIFLEGLDFCGFPLLLEVAFFFLGAADHLTLVTAALKIGHFFCQGAVNGFLAPALRGIPAGG